MNCFYVNSIKIPFLPFSFTYSLQQFPTTAVKENIYLTTRQTKKNHKIHKKRYYMLQDILTKLQEN